MSELLMYILISTSLLNGVDYIALSIAAAIGSHDGGIFPAAVAQLPSHRTLSSPTNRSHTNLSSLVQLYISLAISPGLRIQGSFLPLPLPLPLRDYDLEIKPPHPTRNNRTHTRNDQSKNHDGINGLRISLSQRYQNGRVVR